MGLVLVLGAQRSGVSVVSQVLAEAAGVEVNTLRDMIRSNEVDVVRPKPSKTTSDILGLDFAEVLALTGDLDFSSDSTASQDRHVIQAEDSIKDCVNLTTAHFLLDQNANLRVVVVWRQGVDFVNSRLRAFPKSDFVSHCLIWARAIALMRSLQTRFGPRVLRVEHGHIRSRPKEVVDRLARFVPEWNLDEPTMLRRWAHTFVNRTACIVDRPVVDPAKTGWSMAEVEVFLGICGPAMSSNGDSFDPSAAERRRPIDIAEAMLRRGKAAGGISVNESARRNGAAVLTYGGVGKTEKSTLKLSAIAAGGRRRISLRLALQAPVEAEHLGELGCEIVESVSRRQVFARGFEFGALRNAVVEDVLSEHDGLLEISFTRTGSADGPEFSVAMLVASLASD